MWVWHGAWVDVPVGVVLAHFVEWAPQSPSGSELTVILFWFLDLPLYQVLMAAGLGMTTLGLVLLG